MCTKVVALNSVELIPRHRLERGGRERGWVGKVGESVNRKAGNR